MKFTIFGAGSWGTAIAIHAANLGLKATLVPRRIEHAEQLLSDQENKEYIPGYSTKAVTIEHDPSTALNGADVVLLACPSHALRGLCESIKPHIDKKTVALTLCKGLEQSSLLPPVQVVESVLPDNAAGVLSGPTFAGEVAAGKPTAITLALEDDVLAKKIQESLSSPTLRIYTSQDVLGVDYAACLKNVYAIGAGICDGLKLGDNAKAAYLSRALNELVRLGTSLGGQQQTFYGLSGFGDLVATCFGEWSRNRTFGESVAKGSSPAAFVKAQKTVTEGYWAIEAFHNRLAQDHIDAPILEQLYKVLYEDLAPAEALQSLMARKLKSEA